MLGHRLHVDALAALDSARPDAVVEVLRGVLERYCDPRGVRLLIADQRRTTLQEFQTNVRTAVSQGRAGESFVTQTPVTDVDVDGDTEVYLPVSVHGDPIGVLCLTLAAPVSDEEIHCLHHLATLVAYALQATTGQTDILPRSARAGRLSLAAELQWQLLPSLSCHAPEYAVAGRLEAGRAVYSDSFDWSQDGDSLCLSVTDASHCHGGTLMLSTLAVTAVRNARRGGLGVAEQACLSDEAVFAHHRGERFVNALLVQIDLTTGLASVVRAGSPGMILQRAGTIHRLEFADQLPLGMFEETEYAGQSLTLATGDRLSLVTDGVLGATSPSGERYCDGRLPRVLASSSHEPPGEVVRAVIDDLFEHCSRAELDDDAVVVCLDWTGAGVPDPSGVSALERAAHDTSRSLHSVPSPTSL